MEIVAVIKKSGEVLKTIRTNVTPPDNLNSLIDSIDETNGKLNNALTEMINKSGQHPGDGLNDNKEEEDEDDDDDDEIEQPKKGVKRKKNSSS